MNHQIPEWLEDIQNRSWEPELFISGGAIFFLFQVTDFLYYRSFLLFQQTGYLETLAIAAFLITALNALIVGFVIHLIFRGFWVASVTLSYVFPEGILMNKIHYSEKFKQKITKVPGTVDWVIWMETASSLIFSLSFLFFLIIFGVLISLFVLIPHSGLEEELGKTTFFYLRLGSYILLGLGLVYMLDFVTLGFIKKQKSLSKIYYPIYWFFSLLTLAPLYRTTYYTLVSHVKPWIVLVVSISYILTTALITLANNPGVSFNFNAFEFLNLKSEKYIHNNRYYDDRRKEGELVQHLAIQSEIIKDKYLRLFIVHQKVIENLMNKNCITNKKKEKEIMTCYANFYRIYLDNKLQNNLTWRQFKHSSSGEWGLITFIPIADLSAEEHNLKVVLHANSVESLQKIKQFGMKGATYAIVPFWKE